MFTQDGGEVSIQFDIKDNEEKYLSLRVLASRTDFDPEEFIPDTKRSPLPYWAWRKRRGRQSGGGIYIPKSGLEAHIELGVLDELVLSAFRSVLDSHRDPFKPFSYFQKQRAKLKKPPLSPSAIAALEPDVIYNVFFQKGDFGDMVVQERHDPNTGLVDATQFLYHCVRENDGKRLPPGVGAKLLKTLMLPEGKGGVGLEPAKGTDGKLYFDKDHLAYLRKEFGLVDSFRQRDFYDERGDASVSHSIVI